MAVLLVSLSILGLVASMALPVWSQQARREREAELIFRGEQYARAIELYQRQQPGAFPSDLDTLVEQRYLRRLYADPMVPDGAFRILRQADQQPPGAAEGSREAGSGASGPRGDPRGGPRGGMRSGPAAGGGGSGPRGDRGAGGSASARGDRDAGGSSSARGDRDADGSGLDGGIIGVVSRSTDRSLRLYKGRDRYDEWEFTHGTGSDGPEDDAPPAAGPARGGSAIFEGRGSAVFEGRGARSGIDR